MKFTISLGTWVVSNSDIGCGERFGIYHLSTRRRGSSTHTLETVWPKLRRQPVRIPSKPALKAQADYTLGIISLEELNRIRNL